jgi:hypothetical protein
METRVPIQARIPRLTVAAEGTPHETRVPIQARIPRLTVAAEGTPHESGFFLYIICG